MDTMNIISAQYEQFHGQNTRVIAVIDGETVSVPLDPANRHYAEICRQVEAGELVIEPADTPE